jgi:thioredoxin 1
MNENVMHISDSEFSDLISTSEVPVLVDFWAEWCGPCRMIGPVIEEIADEYAGKAKICKIDIDEHRDAANQVGVQSIPTVVIFKNGQLEKKWVGVTGKDDITEALDELM